MLQQSVPLSWSANAAVKGLWYQCQKLRDGLLAGADNEGLARWQSIEATGLPEKENVGSFLFVVASEVGEGGDG